MAEVGERKKLSHGLLSCFFCGHGITKEEPVQSAVSDEDGITTRSSRTSTAAAVDHNLLGKIADAFKELAEVVAAASNNAEEAVEVAAFSRACSFVAPLFGLVGFHFKFIEMDYVTKVNDLMEASKSFKTLESMVDEDVKTNTVRKQGSHSRNLLKIKRCDIKYELRKFVFWQRKFCKRCGFEGLHRDISFASWLGSQKGCFFKIASHPNKAAIV
ncbi:ACD11 homolog protein isoform X2 [Arachis hypogaea]|uniref:ACD11 homolog protein isoform X2 n=1 Tax=Arachis hypogaea TaxID=3818 RepID=UPI003B21EF4E